MKDGWPTCIYLGFAVPLLLTGCVGNDIRESGPELAVRPLSYLQARQQFGQAMAKRVASNTPNYELVVIQGAHYEPGWVVDARNPADPIDNTACLVDADKIPEISWVGVGFEDTFSRNIDFATSPTQLLQKYLKEIVSVSGGVKKGESIRYSWINPVQRLPTWNDFRAAIDRPECREAIAGKEVLFIRGLVTVEEAFEHGPQLDASAEVKFFSEDAAKLSYERSGSFKLVVPGRAPFYHIVARLPADLVLRGGEGSEAEVLEKPTQGEVAALEELLSSRKP